MSSDLDAKLDKIDEDLDELDTPSTRDVYEAMLPFDKKMVAAAIGQRAVNGGGGGGGDVLIDGGSASAVYTITQNIDGGGA